MYQDYLPPYHAAMKAGAGGVMVALNSINGVPATSNTWLMQDLLRKEWGFKGGGQRPRRDLRADQARRGQGQREAAKLAIKAGIDMSMNDQAYGKELPGCSSPAKTDRAIWTTPYAKCSAPSTTWACLPTRTCVSARPKMTRPTSMPKAACTAPKRAKWRARAWCC
jgi:hypothetical protein